jgi:prolycopene isomerase
MKIYRYAILQDRYDVIVVGAGLGGITAASLLAKRGLSVLLIDQQNKPGGACTSFKREDHVFDAGAAMLYGFGEKGFRPFHFLLNELEEPIDIIAHKTLARMTFEGQEIVFWPDIDRFLEELYKIFPKEKNGLKAFYIDLYKLYENIVIKNEIISPPSELSPRQQLGQLLSDPLAIVKMQRLLSTSTLDLLKKYFHTDEVINFFDKLCSAYAYTTAAETPGVLAATMFLDNHIGGVYFPAGGAQMLPNTVEKAFECYGGQALYGQVVDEILIQDGRAYGVRLDDGTEILAERVIANATVWNIYGRLVRPKHIDPKRLKWAHELIPTYPSMTLYMILEREGLSNDLYPWEIFIENRNIIDSTDLTLYINSLVDSTLCPPNHLVVMAIAPNMCQWPHADEPGYHSHEYEDQKQGEAERMLAQIEQHIPGFRKHLRSLIIGTPTTIERYLLKNGGAVGGPKNQIGQEMLKRLHARSEWQRLYFCGDSTTMGTGAPATTVSGVGAANVILRELHLKEYEPRDFPRQYIRFVAQPYRRPAYNPTEPINENNAWLAAADCQHCQEPACVKSCPAGIDIPGFLRRMEAKNFQGAARLIREKNPFGEVCGLVCTPGRTCQKDCYRLEFAGLPVRIAELQRWVCAETGEHGWIRVDHPASGPEVAVIGGGPSALSCAYYLLLAGYQVHVFATEIEAGGALWRSSQSDPLLKAAVRRDLQGIMSSGFSFYGEKVPGINLDLSQIQDNHHAIYIAEASPQGYPDVYETWLGDGWRDKIDLETGQMVSQPNIFIGEEYVMNSVSVVQALASGRKAACSIDEFLKNKP